MPNLITVCIPTIPSRHSTLSRLLWVLQPQALDVVIAGGEGAMGDKLMACFDHAKTPYVVCVDDDDLLTADYAYHTSFPHRWTTFIGYDVVYLESGVYQASVKHHLGGDPEWNSYDRGVSPKCPVDTDIARSVVFGNEYDADRTWSKHVHDLCKGEYYNAVVNGVYVPRGLYIYDHWNAHMVGTTPDQGWISRDQRDVGTWPFDRNRFKWL